MYLVLDRTFNFSSLKKKKKLFTTIGLYNLTFALKPNTQIRDLSFEEFYVVELN